MQAEAECLNPIHLITTPITLGVILITSALDSPSLPYLGSVTTLVGYPRPQRFWPRFNFLSSTSTRIQGLIYESILPNMMRTLEKEIPRDIKNFQDQSFYLLLNESIGILLSVIERGRNYAIIVARGAEIKSATLCHRDERSRISETLEDVIALQRNCVFSTKGASLTPIKHLNNVKGLIVDTFNLTSRCIFDVDFNKKLLQIFIYLMLDQFECLETLNCISGSQDTIKLEDQLFEKQLTRDQYNQLFDLFPHQFAQHKIKGFKWQRGRGVPLDRSVGILRKPALVTRAKIGSNQGDKDTLSSSSEQTQKMTFSKGRRSELTHSLPERDFEDREPSEYYENTRLDSQIEEQKERPTTGDYTNAKRFSIPPLFASTHKTTEALNKEEMQTQKKHSFGSERFSVRSSYSENVISERDAEEKTKAVRVGSIKLMQTEVRDSFEKQRSGEQQISLTRFVEKQLTGRLHYSGRFRRKEESQDEKQEEGTIMEPWGFKYPGITDNQNNSSQSWNSNAIQQHYIDTRTHFVIELAMICFPFLEGQPDSFFAAYESVLNGYNFISNEHELQTTLDFRCKEKLHQKLQFLFIKALIVTYLRIIRLEDNLKSFEDIRDTIQDYKIMGPQQFSEAKFESENSFGGELNPATTYCTVFFQDDIEIHQVRTGSNDFTMFGLKKEYLRDIWANMMFEIMYINNDNQERNSIQSNRYLLQNLTSELAQHPLGYCPFTSGPMLLYF